MRHPGAGLACATAESGQAERLPASAPCRLLPYLQEQQLYDQFRLDQPWDSQHNRQLIGKMPAVFTCPGADLRSQGKTTYVAPVAARNIFTGEQEGTSIQDIRDGSSNTILVVDADETQAAIWTKPDDLPVDYDQPQHGLSGTIAENYPAFPHIPSFLAASPELPHLSPIGFPRSSLAVP